MLTAIDSSTGEKSSAARRADLSVVIPSVNGLARLSECLDALGTNDAADLALEILVVDRCGEDLRRSVRARYGAVHIVAVGPGTTIPKMREAGFRRASADAIAVIEDHVLVPRDWARQLLAALAAGADVVGGSVRNAATGRLVDRAAFFCEYSHLLPPLAAGPAARLTGNNVAYRRSAVERHWDAVAAGRWEDYLHEAMRRDGVRLVCHPEICVLHKMHYRVREYLAQRFWYARAWAGMRAADMSAGGRAARAAGSALLPAVLLVRMVGRGLGTGSHGAELVQSLPLLLLFALAWAMGEAIGYAAGPGDALSRVA